MLMTAAPCSIARAMPATELAQRISLGQADVERAHARPDAEDAAVVLRRRGDGGGLGPVRALDREAAERCETLPPANSGWLTSAVESMSASSGLVGRDRRRDQAGVDDRGAPGGAGVERVGRRGLHAAGRAGWARRRAAGPRARSARGELARAAARDDVGAGADPAGAVARRRSRRRRAAGRAPTSQVERSPARRPPPCRRAAPSVGERGGGRAGRSAQQPATTSGGRGEAAAHRPTVGTPSAQWVGAAVARPHRAQQRGRGAVALLAVLVAEGGQHAEHRRGADRVAPLERAARVVEAEHHAGVDVLGGADAVAEREARLVDELAHDPAEHEPGRVADPLDVAAERGEERLGGARGGVRGRRAARELDEPAERRGGEEAGRAPSGSSSASGASSHRTTCGPPCSGVGMLAARRCRRASSSLEPRRSTPPQSTISAGTSSPAAPSGSATRQPASSRRLAQRVGQRRSSRAITTQAVAAAARAAGRASGGRCSPPSGYSYQPRPVLRPWSPDATLRAASIDGRQRGSPNDCA